MNTLKKRLLLFFLIIILTLCSISVAFASTISIPTNIVATVGNTTINLTWAPVNGASYYNIYESLDNKSYNLISAPGTVSTLSYNVKRLTNSKLYYFKISAVSNVFESTCSDAVSITPLVGTLPVKLGTAANYTILAQTGITNVSNSAVTGDIAVGPIASAMTGFGLTKDPTNIFSTSTQVAGKVYATDYALPTPFILGQAAFDLGVACIDASIRPPTYINKYAGVISGQTLTPGVYKYTTGVSITSDVTLSGGPNDVYIFQIAKGVIQGAGCKVLLTGGLQAKNVFWQTCESSTIAANSHFEGILLSHTGLTVAANSSITGRILAQTSVTLVKNTITPVETTAHNYSISITGNPMIKIGQSAPYISHIYDNGIEILNQSVRWDIKNQDNSTPLMSTITSSTGTSANVQVNSNSTYESKYVVLSATEVNNPSNTIDRLILIK